ncbi:hypothetical protein [Bacillus phage phiAGATE]|uniref:Uncharacterized protein n=1 Tax=Bacillus phage phiAGATE TaxID=1204533 RepID=L0LAC0_9CAUD|nr:hypothetical protein G380_gp007 [Bacillus phage phiAGATE]AGB62657.1 hypothetical protein [Bacillus phage phiAGATE]
MKVKDVLHQSDLKELLEEIYEVEFESTLDEGWTVNNNTLEAKTFLSLSEEGKILYAMNHASAYIEKVKHWTKEEFYQHYGSRFHYYINS